MTSCPRGILLRLLSASAPPGCSLRTALRIEARSWAPSVISVASDSTLICEGAGQNTQAAYSIASMTCSMDVKVLASPVFGPSCFCVLGSNPSFSASSSSFIWLMLCPPPRCSIQSRWLSEAAACVPVAGISIERPCQDISGFQAYRSGMPGSRLRIRHCSEAHTDKFGIHVGIVANIHRRLGELDLRHYLKYKPGYFVRQSSPFSLTPQRVTFGRSEPGAARWERGIVTRFSHSLIFSPQRAEQLRGLLRGNLSDFLVIFIVRIQYLVEAANRHLRPVGAFLPADKMIEPYALDSLKEIARRLRRVRARRLPRSLKAPPFSGARFIFRHFPCKVRMPLCVFDKRVAEMMHASSSQYLRKKLGRAVGMRVAFRIILSRSFLHSLLHNSGRDRRTLR